MDDDALGLAAQLAYYFFLALFPAILCVIALGSNTAAENDHALRQIQTVLKVNIAPSARLRFHSRRR